VNAVVGKEVPIKDAESNNGQTARSAAAPTRLEALHADSRAAARRTGLVEVRVGNRHLLGLGWG